MAHIHSVYDTDTHFKIDAVTRAVKNASDTKTMVVQHDHNSERFTFELPRLAADGHDMSKCNSVQVHYNNADAKGNGSYFGVYEVDDFQVSPESDDIVIFSWLISRNATQYVGKLSFAIRFVCSQEGEVDYEWNTVPHNGVFVSNGINNSVEIEDRYPDVLIAHDDRIRVLEQGGASDELIEQAVYNYLEENPVEVANVVKTVNGIAPDSDGNVDIAVSGGTAVASVEPAEDDIPKVYFTGTLPTSKGEEDVRLTMHYISKTADFTYPVTLKVQGGSSVSYPKKNFTLKPYKDATYEKKQKLAFKNWGELNKFVLKAHWIDHSHVRNVGTAKIWGKVVKARSDYNSLPEELRNSPNNGATDGFTCKVFCNGVYQGLYEWIVPKDKLFGQDSDIATHSILNSEWNNQQTCAFSTTSPVMNGNWSEELRDSMSSGIATSFANLIKFVAGSTDEEFVANAENYFDVQSVIDFDIFARVFCIVDNLCRNQIFFTYNGTKWYEGVWDVDAILGLPPTSRGFFEYDTEFQTGYIAYKDYGMTNLLYQRVETLFTDRFKARYAELRSGVLSIENILDVYERLTDVITTYDGLLAEDHAKTTGEGKFTGIPYTSQNNIQQIREFVSKRIPYMDAVIESMSAPIDCTGIALSASELTFTAEGEQTIIATATPDGCTDSMVWISSNPSIASISVDGAVCTVTAVANGNATITVTCGDYSASCSVAVSGLSEAIACTGITLDQTELTFDGEGSQTLIATVEPSNTTDTVVWSSDNTNVAVVNDGIVTAIGGGTAVITATCGNKYAICSVKVNIVEVNILSDVELSEGNLNHESGADIATSSMVRTGYADITAYRGQEIYLATGTQNKMNEHKIIFYDDSKNLISAHTAKVECGGVVPSNAVYARFTAPKTSFLSVRKVEVDTQWPNIFSTVGKTEGKFFAPESGNISTYAAYNSNKLDIEPNATYRVKYMVSGVLFDSNDSFVSTLATNMDKANAQQRLIMTTENTASIGVNYWAEFEDNVAIEKVTAKLIGEISINLT